MGASIPPNNREGFPGALNASPNSTGAEEILRGGEERFRQIADAAPVMIWLAGTDKLCTYVNKRCLEFTGRSFEQDTGQGWVDNVHPDDAKKCVEQYQQCFDRRERFRMEYRLRRYDGQYRWILDSGAPRYHEDGSFAGYVGSALDVTERKMTEEALHTGEERLRLAQQAARMGAFEFNLETGANVWTAELEEIYGLPPGGFAGTAAAFLALVHPDDRPLLVRTRAESIESGEPARAEWRVIWPDGTVHWVVGRWRVFKDERGKPSRMIGVNVDISERKQTEQELLQVQRRLVEAQEQERVRISRELHDDINQRLAILAIEVDHLQIQFPRSAARRNYRLADLKQRLTEVSSAVQSLSHQLHPSQLQYVGLVGAMRSFCRDYSERQTTNIDFTAAHVPKDVPHDLSVCLFRVLQEAVHNAAKHGEAQRIKVNLSSSSNEVQLAISDNGKGFDVDESSSNGGLGLISMRERMRLVGGTITINSTRGGGTTIRVTAPLLPLAPSTLETSFRS